MKKIYSGILMAALLLLTGCFSSGEGMYQLPRPADEYLNLNNKISEVMRSLGAEYAAPLSGSNTQTVQLVDLDGDGTQESAVTFFRVAGAERPLKIYIFRQQDESYETACIIEGDGNAIYAIHYENLGGTAAKEIVVGWQMSTNVQTLAAYAIDGGETIELMRTGYARFRIMDMDVDGNKEMLVIQALSAEEGGNFMEMYDYNGTLMALRDVAPLSVGVSEIRTIRSGLLRDGVPALFVGSAFGEERDQLVDVFAWRNGALCNITLDPVSGISSGTVRIYTAVAGQDIDGDGVFELPVSEQLPEFNKVSGSPDYWLLHWWQYDADGVAWPVCTTYHNVSDGWYLKVPEEWRGKITITRRDASSIGERRVTFSVWNGEEEPTPFLTIYMLVGANRAARAAMGNRAILRTQMSTIYAYEFLDADWDCGLDKDELLERFGFILTEWSTEN